MQSLGNDKLRSFKGIPITATTTQQITDKFQPFVNVINQIFELWERSNGG